MASERLTEPPLLTRVREFIANHGEHIRDKELTRVSWGDWKAVVAYVDALVLSQGREHHERSDTAKPHTEGV